MKKKTYVALILDQSGSMMGTVEQAAQGYNEQVQQMKLNSAEQDIEACLVSFNGEVYEHQWLKKAADLVEATKEEYIACGSTALRDAIGYTIDKLVKTTDVNDENNAYLVVIISDGEENASRHYSESELKRKIEALQETKRWTFTYMGCNESYLRKVADATSIPVTNMAVWSNATPQLATRGFGFASSKIGCYYSARKAGLCASNNMFSNDAAVIADASNQDALASQDALTANIASQNTVNTTTATINTNDTKAFCNYKPVTW